MDNMEDQLRSVLRDFKRILDLEEAEQWHLVQMEFYEAPHEPGSLPRDKHAAYLFFRGQDWLRIGQTTHAGRFTSQHYGTKRAGSNFAKDVWRNRDDFGFSGKEADVGDWIKVNCGRANILLPSAWPQSILPLLEAYLHYRLVPRFEGRRN